MTDRETKIGDYFSSQLGIDLADYNLVHMENIPRRYHEILYQQPTFSISKFNNRYMVKLFNKNFLVDDSVLSFIVIHKTEMHSVNEITKNMYKALRDVSKIVRVYKLRSGNNAWITANEIKISKHIPLMSQNYQEFTEKIEIIKSYSKRGVTFNTNMLLSGPPGTGKSRFVTDIAVYLSYPIYSLSIAKNDIEGVANLKKCIFLIEEVDKEMAHDGSFIDPTRVNESQLLCFLDGHIRHPNTILIMTCNDLDKVKRNKVFSRKGRINKIYKFSGITFEQCKYMINLYYDSISDEQISQFFDSLPKKPMITIAVLSSFIQDNVLNKVAFADLDIKGIHDNEQTSQFLYN